MNIPIIKVTEIDYFVYLMLNYSISTKNMKWSFFFMVLKLCVLLTNSLEFQILDLLIITPLFTKTSLRLMISALFSKTSISNPSIITWKFQQEIVNYSEKKTYRSTCWKHNLEHIVWMSISEQNQINLFLGVYWMWTFVSPLLCRRRFVCLSKHQLYLFTLNICIGCA